MEGSSDIPYLRALSSELKARKRTALDPCWILCFSGEIGSIMLFVSLFTGKNLYVAVLSDMAQGTKGKVEKIRESEVSQAEHFSR